LAPFINCVINDDRLTYISSANEGDALATAAGAVIGGRGACVMMQNSGLGNTVNPLTSLAYTFRIPLLLICTLRGDPEFKDEPQHALMGRITGRLFETMEVPWELFPAETAGIEPVLDRAEEHFAKERRPYALIMRKGSVAPHPLRKEIAAQRRQGDRGSERFYNKMADARPTRNQALRRIIERSPEKGTVLVATTGYTGRELFALNDRANHLCMVGSMGCASSLGLGLALTRPDLRVIVIDGDGAALMRMGNFATIGAYGGPNLIHIVLDNEAHDSTGAQGTVSAKVSFAGIAAACGYRVVMEGDDLALLDALLAGPSDSGPRFGHLKIRPGTIQSLPRPTLSPGEALERLMAHIGSRS
jgi:phosphonopyruvate decarboxylase